MTVGSFVLLLGVFNFIERSLRGDPNEAGDSDDAEKGKRGSDEQQPKAGEAPAGAAGLAVHS
jgi:hypothetical protein